MARALLELALQLLIAAQAANVPTDLKIQAVQTATYAIEYAQASMDDNLAPFAQAIPIEAPYEGQSAPISPEQEISLPKTQTPNFPKR